MSLQEKDQESFKRWVLPKLETISDADAEVLADYVIALVSANDSEANIKRNCVDSLSDFLQDYTEPFVNDVLKVLREKTYLWGPTKIPTGKAQPTPLASIVETPNAEYQSRTSRITNSPPRGAPTGPSNQRIPTGPLGLREQDGGTRKRKTSDRESSLTREGQDPHYSFLGAAGRPPKQTARRGGRSGRGAGQGLQNGQFVPMQRYGGFPQSLPELPPFDPSNPFSLILAAQAMGLNIPGIPTLPFTGAPVDGGDQHVKRQRCEDYYKKGYCALGSFCPKEHGDAIEIPANEVSEYDPDHASMGIMSGENAKGQNKKGRSQARGRRSSFSLQGPSHDPENTTLVVEAIPRANFNEEDIRGFFSQFGEIEEITLHNFKRVAVLNFATRDAASQAYISPTPVFNNRFVKVYWYKSDAEHGFHAASNGMEMNQAVEEEKIDLEEVARRQAEAQKAFEERRRREREVQERAEEIERLLKEKNEEMRIIKQQLAALAGEEAGELDDEFSQSLATLQAEAEDLFAQHDGSKVGPRRDGHRAGYRGRGHAGFIPRGRGYPRGGNRGRGSPAHSFYGAQGAVKRLDNRPRRLVVKDIQPDSSRDEALRQHLINVPDAMIERHPSEANSLLLTFKERYQAEQFLDDSRTIAGVGKLDLSWVLNDDFGGLSNTTSPPTDEVEKDEDSDAESDGTVGRHSLKIIRDDLDMEAHHGSGMEADMDVADDVDQWR